MIRQGIIMQSFQYNAMGKTAIVTAASGKQAAIIWARVQNSGGQTNPFSIVRKYAAPTSAAPTYKLFTHDNTTFTPVTIPIPSATSIFTLTNNEGFAIQAKSKWNVWGVTISQAQTGSPVYEYTYWNGSSFATLTHAPTLATAMPSYAAAQDIVSLFAAPADWAPGGGGALDANMYTMRARATTAPTQAVQITDIWVGQCLDFQFAVNNSNFVANINPKYPIVLEGGESLIPYFGSSSTSNYISVGYVNI